VVCCVCVCVYVCFVCTCVPICFVQIYTKGVARARAPKKKKGIPFRKRIVARKKIPLGRVQRVPLPAFFPLHSFFLLFRHSEYVVPILTGVPFSSVKMKNQKALDLKSSA